MDYIDLINILEQSVKKHGEQPLTNKWLLNIVKLADKEDEHSDIGYDPNWD